MEHAGHGLPEANADENAERDPERQEPLEFPQGRGFLFSWPSTTAIVSLIG